MSAFLEKTTIFIKNIYRNLRTFYWLEKAKKLSLNRLSVGVGPTVLILLPESGISIYAKSSMVIADQLRRQGHKVVFARCFNVFERCIFMDSESLPLLATPKEKKQLCTYCFRSFQKNIILNKFEFVDLRNSIFKQDYDEIEQVINNNLDSAFEFIYENINFSGILEYNLFLYLKKSDIAALNSEELAYWQQYLKSLFVGYKAVKRIVQEYKITHILMCDEYSLNAVVKDFSLIYGFSAINYTFPYHRDVDLTQIRILHKDSLSENNDAIMNWPQFKSLSISVLEIREAVDDLIIRMSKRGTYSYSPSKSSDIDIIEQFGLDKNLKTIVAYPSSPDEIDALINANKKRNLPLCEPNDAFVDQYDWMDELIKFVEESNEFQLVLRMHPRMAPNHREKWGCYENDKFFTKYSSVHRNVKVIWPEDPVSSYDLAEIADVVTVAWSSMGNFMARLGIPVISGLKISLPIPNDEFHVFADTKGDYFNSFKLLSEREPSFSRMLFAYRFYNMFYLSNCVDFGDVLNDKQEYSNITSVNADMLSNAVIESKSVAQMNLKRLRESQTQINLTKETEELSKQIYRLLHFFMTNQDNVDIDQFPIFFRDCTTSMTFIENHSLIIEDGQVTYSYDGKKYRKFSRLVERLAKIAIQNQKIIPPKLESRKNDMLIEFQT